MLAAARKSLDLLSRRDRRLLVLSMIIQMSTSLLDLVGVVLLGLVAALAVTTVQSQPPPAVVESLAETFMLGNLSQQQLVIALSVVAASVLLLKSLASSYLTRRNLTFLANRQAGVSARLSKQLLSQPLTFVQRRSSQETAYILISGTAAATIQVLGQLTIAVSELALLVVLGSVLLVISPVIAVGAIIFFGVVGFGLQRTMGRWASRIGHQAAEADVASLSSIQEAIGAYREVFVLNRRHRYVERIQELRWKAAHVTAEWQFINMFPKYMFEVALVLGGFVLAGVLFATTDSVTAVGTLALFLAAGTRVMPSMLRLQSATLGMRGAASTAASTFELAEELQHSSVNSMAGDNPSAPNSRNVAGSRNVFVPEVRVSEVSFTYPGKARPSIRNCTLLLPPGSTTALVGRSGAGKSTLADLILGVLHPDSGSVRIGGEPPETALIRWSGAIAYVPQAVHLTNGTIRANVALGLPEEQVEDEFVWEALARAQLDVDIKRTPGGLDSIVGERGVQLSGGQRQRLGLARALYTQPTLIVLDEATSALDAQTEHLIATTLSELGNSVTKIIIAHRLSTVRNADTVVYLDEGAIVASGTFADVVREVPAFMEQAHLMGQGS